MRLVLAIFLLNAGLLAQRTWIVRCTAGAGVDFTDLPPAVAAAAPRDTILLVADSQCSAYSAAVLDKPLQVIGVQGTAMVQGLIEVRSIQAGERLLLANITIPIDWSLAGPANGIRVHDCAGSVHLQDFHYQPGFLPNAGIGCAQFVDCANLTMHGCDLAAPGRRQSPPAGYSAAVLFRRTHAALRECRLRPVIETDTVSIEDSDVAIIDSRVDGPSAYFNSSLEWSFGGGFAIAQNGGSLTLGPATFAMGGWLPPYGLPSQDNAVVSYAGSIVQDPNSRDSGCVCPRRQFRIVPAVLMDSVFRNRAFNVGVRGEPHDFALLGLGDYAPPGVALPGVRGQLLLAPQGLFLPAAAQLSAAGSFQFTFTMDPGFPMDVVLALQAGLIHGNGSLELTEAAPFSVLWEPGRTWP